MSSEDKMFKDLPEWIRDILRRLSSEGFIYIGRTGVGLSNDFRKATMQKGTIKAIDDTMQFHGLNDKVLMEMIATEGPRYVSYTRIMEFMTTGLYEVLRQGR